MSVKCKKCGCEIDGNTPICMNCGAAVSESDLTQEAKERLEQEKHDTHVASGASSAKAFGATLIIIGMLIDVVSMFLIFDGDASSFGMITIIGTILFLAGLFFVSNG